VLQALAWLVQVHPLLLFAALAGILYAAAETGYRVGRRACRRKADEPVRSGIGFIVGGMVGMLAFLLGVTLSIAEARHDDRRDAVLEEANALGTAWLRAGVVGGREGEEIQAILAGYAALRIAAVRDAATAADEARITAETAARQAALSALASTISRERPTAISALLAASLNDVFDAATTERRAFDSGVPAPVLRVLLWTSIVSVGAMGYSFGAAGARQTVMTLLLLLLWASTMVLLTDINRPRHSAVPVTAAPLEWTLESFGPRR
jgi:hypothetical protein